MLIPNGSIPLYEQLRTVIRQEIVSGAYAAGERMPSETELENRFGVSRITVRRAIEDLEKDGLLERKQGRGTFVIYNKVKSNMDSIMGFTDSMVRMGRTPRRTILSKKVIKAGRKLADILGINKEDSVIELKRVLCDEEQALLYDESYYPCARFPDLMEKLNEDVSTYQLLKEGYGVVMPRAHKRFNVEIADKEISKILNCSEGEPLFSIFKIVYDRENVPVHSSKSLVLANRATYVLNVDQSSQSSTLQLQVRTSERDPFLMTDVHISPD